MAPPRARTVEDLQRAALAHTFFAPTTLPRALEKLGFVQADPLRAPARAQDLTLRHRVAGYRAGDLERRYPALALEEDFFVNAGFVTRAVHALMHPRRPPRPALDVASKQAVLVLDAVRARGVAHPRELARALALGTTANWFGGRSAVTTRILEALHYLGSLRVARREAGVRLYSVREPTPTPADPLAAHDALIDLAVAKYAPLPAATLTKLVQHLRGGVPQWSDGRAAALARAKRRLARDRIDGVDWYWPADAPLRTPEAEDRVRLLTPFDPLVWDRQRFELLYRWAYRFEAYTPAAKRTRGYYALPLLWRERVLGWANARVEAKRLVVDLGFVSGKAPTEAAFRRGFEEEYEGLRAFLGASRDGRDAAEP